MRVLNWAPVVLGLLASPAVEAQTAPARTQAEKDAEARAATFGLGAVVGVATYNMLTTAVAAGLPAATGSALGVVGAIGASTAMVWVRNTYEGERTEYRQLIPVGAGALAGVAAGDVAASAIMGFSPFAAAAGGVLPSFPLSMGGIAAGLYTYTTGVIGARVADMTIGIEPQR